MIYDPLFICEKGITVRVRLGDVMAALLFIGDNSFSHTVFYKYIISFFDCKAFVSLFRINNLPIDLTPFLCIMFV